MAAVEIAPRRKRLTTFTIESIVGSRSRSVSPSSKSSPLPTITPSSSTRHHVEDSSPQRSISPSLTPVSSTADSAAGSGVQTSSSSSSSTVADGATSARRHLELLARFAAPHSLTGATGAGSDAGQRWFFSPKNIIGSQFLTSFKSFLKAY